MTPFPSDQTFDRGDDYPITSIPKFESERDEALWWDSIDLTDLDPSLLERVEVDRTPREPQS